MSNSPPSFDFLTQLPDQADTLYSSICELSTDFCNHCRQPAREGKKLSTCTRCGCAKYCGRDCQVKNHKLHKKDCKAIRTQRDKVEDGLRQPYDPGNIEAAETRALHLQDYIERTINYYTSKDAVLLADLILKVGYRESDTVQHAASYYRQALRFYLLPLALLKREYQTAYGWIEDRVLLLLIALGGDRRHIRFLTSAPELSSRRRHGYFATLLANPFTS